MIIAHKRRHSGEKPYSCNQCNYSLSRPWHLKTQKLTRSGQKPFSCDQCNYKCKQRHHLKVHKERKHGAKVKIWNSEKKQILANKKRRKFYNCEQCDKVDMTKPALVNHKYDFHGKFTQCLLCDYKTRRKGNMKIHTQALHEGITYPCDICGYETSTSRNLLLHKKSKH